VGKVAKVKAGEGEEAEEKVCERRMDAPREYG